MSTWILEYLCGRKCALGQHFFLRKHVNRSRQGNGNGQLANQNENLISITRKNVEFPSLTCYNRQVQRCQIGCACAWVDSGCLAYCAFTQFDYLDCRPFPTETDVNPTECTAPRTYYNAQYTQAQQCSMRFSPSCVIWCRPIKIQLAWMNRSDSQFGHISLANHNFHLIR